MVLIAFVWSILLLGSPVVAQDEPFRVLHVMSYHPSWEWNIAQYQGFKDGLGDLDVEYRVVALDTKREADQGQVAERVAESQSLIASWKPDLLYTNDDNAQELLAKDYVGTALPIVFSAVNRDPSEYGFLGAKNVTGVMEYEHYIPTINLLRSMVPDIKRIAVIVDSDPTWKGVMARMRASAKQLEGIEIREWLLVHTYADFKAKVLDLQDQVDAIAMLGIFNLQDSQGENVAYEEVLKWTVENSRLPDFSFWESRVSRGTLCTVTVSGYEQGFLAGTMARQILHDGVSPGDIDIRPSQKGQPMISMPRAKSLGIQVDVRVLLDSTVKSTYAWDPE
jgi:ABC-type uncharacterized transport system substrate-binding protein